jgi:hypothetical protein
MSPGTPTGAQVVKAVLVGIWQSLKMMTAALPLGI